MEHKHNVTDQDRGFYIDPTQDMAITCEGTVKALKRGDHNSEVYSFSMPRVIEGHDMSLCNKVEIHYNNIRYDRSTRETTVNKSFAEAEGFGLDTEDADTVTWTWQPTGDATQLDGKLAFCVRFACMEGETITYQKFSGIFEAIPVGDTIHNTEEMAKEYADVLEAWRQEIFAAIDAVSVTDDQIASAVAAYMANHPVSGGGITSAAANLLIEILRNGVYSNDQSANITALKNALSVMEPDEPEPPVEPDEPVVPDVTLSSISATYSGGDVTVGTALTDLTGIVVTAHYSDGTSETVTGYTLSGTIVEGPSTVTVSYGGKTTTFTVTGVAESGTETPGTVVAMSAEMVHGDMTKSGHYSDAGSTAFKDDRFPAVNGRSAVSEKVFEKDTKLKITLAPTTTVFQCMLFCSTLMDADKVLTSEITDNFYWCESSKAGFAYAWSTEEHTWEYTVKAGYKFGVITINAGTLPTKVEVV